MFKWGGVDSGFIHNWHHFEYAGRHALTAIKLSKKAPSPAGEGWGEENKTNSLNFPSSQPSPSGEGGRVLNLMAVGHALDKL
jgi:hypothetical protein